MRSFACMLGAIALPMALAARLGGCDDVPYNSDEFVCHSSADPPTMSHFA